jgi:tripeptide aminopeptidase
LHHPRRYRSDAAITVGLLFMISATALAQRSSYDEDVARIAARADVRQAFATIHRLEPETVSDLITLTQIPAPAFMEAERGRRYAEMLRTAGADSVWTDEVGNVIALRRGRGGGRRVVLNAHLDTVFPEGTDVTVRHRGDTLAAPGIGDDTRGLSIVLAVLKSMEAAQIETDADVWFVATVGEEGLGDLRGMKHMFRQGGPKIDAWIAIDGIDINSVTHRGLGSHRYRITFRGPGGHSWGAFGIGNPHHALGIAIDHFVAAADPFTREGPRTNYNVGVIGGGTSVNSIPFESWMEVDMRSVSPERLNGVDSLLQRAVQQALREANDLRREGDPLTVDVKLIGDRPSGEIAVSNPLVQRAVAATAFVGAQPELRIGSTDSNIPISMGIPAVTIGAGGDGGGAHSLHEWWMNKDGEMGIRRALLILVSEAGLSAPVP